MLKKDNAIFVLLLCLSAVFFMLFATHGLNHAVTVISENRPIQNRKCIVIDAGHGGEDGGAVSSSGTLESKINLEIAVRLNDLFRLFGCKTCMIRTTDCSVYTSGETLSAKKVSDLKERVRIVNETEDAFLISIHQNFYPEYKYSGAQVFYRKDEKSKLVAKELQIQLRKAINPQNKRDAKPANGIYLMDKIHQPGVLVECGFLSNPQEDRLLQTSEYQKILCCVVVSTICDILYVTPMVS